MTNVDRTLGVLASLFVIGCAQRHLAAPDASDPMPVDSATGLSIENFCPEYVAASCDVYHACECDDPVDRCREIETICRSWLGSSEIRAGLADNVLAFDPELAHRLIEARDRQAQTCGPVSNVVDWTVSERTLPAPFRGQLPAGSDCSGVPFNPCRDGECGVDTTCRAFADLGEACSDETIACIDRTRLAYEGPLELIETANAYGFCDNDRCAPLVSSRGESCEQPLECSSHVCEAGRCADRVALGGMCDRPSACESGVCGAVGAEDRCQPPLPAGSSCALFDVCAGGRCHEGRCVPYACIPSIGLFVESPQ